MRIEKFNNKNLDAIYGIHGKLLDTPKEPVYMGSMLGHLASGETTRNHAHHDHEQFVILKGEGLFKSNQKVVPVAAGDVIHLEPGDPHILKNEHPSDELVFISVWWTYKKGADIPEKNNVQHNACLHNLILSPPPTPNGDLHLGHLAGPYLGADILRRHLLQQNKTVFYLTGSDDNQSYVDLKANQLQANPVNIANTFANNIGSIFSAFDISPDVFYRPLNNQDYTEFVQNFFQTLFSRSVIVPKVVKQPFCISCDRWLFEAHIGGFCPSCGTACGGGSCETCGFPNDEMSIVESFCKYCKTPPSYRQTQKIYLTLKNYQKYLISYWERLSLPSHIRALTRNIIDKGLPDIAVTQHSNWGIPAPFTGFDNQTLCSWCEMVAGYLFSLQKSAVQKTEWQNIWNDIHTGITLFFGFDNSFFYTCVMPATLLAYNLSTKLPDFIIYNEYYLFEQQKFSTSRSHAVWAKDIINKVPIDMLRYYLAATRPEFSKTQFSYTTLIELINQDLVTHLSNWIVNLAKRIQEHFNSICPDGGEWNTEHEELVLYLRKFIKLSKEAYSILYFSPSAIIRLLRELVVRCQKLSEGALFLQNNYYNKLEYQTSLVLELTALKYYAMVSAPIMPTFSINIARALQITNLHWEDEITLIAKDTPIGNLGNIIFTILKLKNINPSPEPINHET